MGKNKRFSLAAQTDNMPHHKGRIVGETTLADGGLIVSQVSLEHLLIVVQEGSKCVFCRIYELMEFGCVFDPW